MAHGITLAMRKIRRPAAVSIHSRRLVGTGIFASWEGVARVNPHKDRRLAGKARIHARREARRAAR